MQGRGDDVVGAGGAVAGDAAEEDVDGGVAVGGTHDYVGAAVAVEVSGDDGGAEAVVAAGARVLESGAADQAGRGAPEDDGGAGVLVVADVLARGAGDQVVVAVAVEVAPGVGGAEVVVRLGVTGDARAALVDRGVTIPLGPAVDDRQLPGGRLPLDGGPGGGDGDVGVPVPVEVGTGHGSTGVRGGRGGPGRHGEESAGQDGGGRGGEGGAEVRRHVWGSPGRAGLVAGGDEVVAPGGRSGCGSSADEVTGCDGAGPSQAARPAPYEAGRGRRRQRGSRSAEVKESEGRAAVPFAVPGWTVTVSRVAPWTVRRTRSARPSPS
ncbi:hypothetical protein CCOS2040_14375 [Streptomyces albidoflavus]|nr:hypothetical protein CCOS2040_14375 [Streptomyces albidoflavus]